jgi:transposase
VRQACTVGVDVSAKELVVAIRRGDGTMEGARFLNTAEGHRRLIRTVTDRGGRARVVLEWTGVYSLELALALHHAARVEVMVANPRAVRDFGRALMKRTKTDPEDAEVILEFAERMPFQPWQAPSGKALALRTITRRIAAMKQDAAAEKNRLHAADYLEGESGRVIRRDIEVNLAHLERRILSLTDHALAVMRSDEELKRRYGLLLSVTGIAQTSALQILGELIVLPRDMTAREWVAHAGLDPRHFESGTSINKPARISKTGNQRLRAILFFPAMVAIEHEPQVRACAEALKGRGKKPLQAVVAIMRRLLHSLHAMFRLNVPFDPKKFARPLDFQESGRVEVRRGCQRSEELLFPAHVPVPQFASWPRLLSPLVEPDVRFSRIRLSDWFHARTDAGCAS